MSGRTSWYWELTLADFAERLKAMREQRGLTQTRLSEILDVSPRVYNRWERGGVVPHFDTVVKLADILQVSLDELAGRTDDVSDPAIHNHRLHLLCRQADRLPDDDQKALIVLMDSLIKRATFERVLAD